MGWGLIFALQQDYLHAPKAKDSDRLQIVDVLVISLRFGVD